MLVGRAVPTQEKPGRAKDLRDGTLGGKKYLLRIICIKFFVCFESVLNYMALPSGASEKSVSLETRQTLNECGLIKSTGGSCELTSDGFQFLLMSVEKQIWTYLLHYISKGVPVHNALMIILYACVCGVNSPYCTDAFTEADLNFVQHLREVGLVYLRKRKSGWFYYTPLLARITGCSNADDSVNKKPGFLVVETNFRVYCYTGAFRQLNFLRLTGLTMLRFPNLIVAILTRESVRHAFKVNISAEQIIQYLNTNAHRNMLKKRPVIPATITDQLKLWELEHDRFTFQSGVLYSGFLSDSDYEIGVALWFNDANRLLIVTAEGHEPTKQFWKRQKQPG
ncbi:General transcription factor IIH subunit 4 [Trichuris trichiura]|uniref:General transcription factor IIH subunit 4 n=1 Tax=Trichuris trichiura TaxID=36087 RepID=A0A077YYP1_TRITR|nr:General transcription factor IIH subunit 4 [Trichuris trichiura]